MVTSLTMKQKLYLDLCCLNRPFDAQDQEKVQIQTEAVVVILASIQRGDNVLIGSRPLDWEREKCRDPERMMKVGNMLKMAKIFAEVGDAEIARADEVCALGFDYYDALHIACAEAVEADYLLTTDDDFLRRCVRFSRHLRVKVCNPANWSRGV